MNTPNTISWDAEGVRTLNGVRDVAQPVQPATDIHSCSYFCERPACIKKQRDDMRWANIDTTPGQHHA